MTVTLSSAGGSSVPNWTLLQTATPSGVATVTFSGLSGYAKYRILAPTITLASAGVLSMRINADSGSNYFMLVGTGSLVSANTNFYLNANYFGTAQSGWAEIDSALLLAPKFVTIALGAAGGLVASTYNTTSAITSFTVFSSVNFAAGTIYLLGAN